SAVGELSTREMSPPVRLPRPSEPVEAGRPSESTRPVRVRSGRSAMLGMPMPPSRPDRLRTSTLSIVTTPVSPLLDETEALVDRPATFTPLTLIRPWRTDRSGTLVPTAESTELSLLWASILRGLIDPEARRPTPTGVLVPATDTALDGKLTGMELSVAGT